MRENVVAKDDITVKVTCAKPPGPHAVRAYLKKLIDKAGIDKKVTPHKFRHPFAGKGRTIGGYSGPVGP